VQLRGCPVYTAAEAVELMLTVSTVVVASLS